MSGYNGWANYETWAVKLWLDNDQDTQEYWHDAAREALAQPNDSGVLNDAEHARYTLAERLKDEHEEQNPLQELRHPSVYSDLLAAALGSVDWSEIAQSLLDDIGEEDDDNE
jgi:SOS response regulatory protein OraA/RecX